MVWKPRLMPRSTAVLGAVTAMVVGAIFAAPALGAKAHAHKSAPIVIAVTAPVNSQIASYPQYFHGVQAYADAVNATGGLGGRRLKILTCDNQFNPDVMANCARSAVSAGAVAMVGNGPTAQSFLSILAAKHIPWMPADPFTPLEYQQPNVFVSTIGYVYLNTAEVALASYAKCPSVAVWYSTLIPGVGTAIAAALQTEGIKSTLVAVAQLGHKFHQIISTNALTTKFSSQYPSVWNGTLIANTLTDYQGPTWATFRAAMHKYFPTEVSNPEAAQVWPLAAVLGSVATYLNKHGKTVNAKNVFGALSSNHSWSSGGVIPNVNYTKSLGVTGFPRLVTGQAGFQTVKNGAVTGAFGNKYMSITPFIKGKTVPLGTL
jgi:Periplasmic binding protein